jgi:Flp pilus assembly protein TadG
LLAPVLILGLLGMAEIGNALNSYLTIVATARDASRLYAKGDATDASIMAMVDRETGRLENVVDTSSVGNCASQQLGICKITDGTPPDSDAFVSVRVCYDHPMIIGIPLVLPGPIRMCSTTVMRVAE